MAIPPNLTAPNYSFSEKFRANRAIPFIFSKIIVNRPLFLLEMAAGLMIL